MVRIHCTDWKQATAPSLPLMTIRMEKTSVSILRMKEGPLNWTPPLGAKHAIREGCAVIHCAMTNGEKVNYNSILLPHNMTKGLSGSLQQLDLRVKYNCLPECVRQER